MKLNADHTKALLAIQTEPDAHGVEELIRQLAMQRAQMESDTLHALAQLNQPVLT